MKLENNFGKAILRIERIWKMRRGRNVTSEGKMLILEILALS